MAGFKQAAAISYTWPQNLSRRFTEIARARDAARPIVVLHQMRARFIFTWKAWR